MMNESMDDYELVFIILDNCLIHTKSGNYAPKNIADFMPDYNVWYGFRALKNLKRIVILSNRNLERDPSFKNYYIRCDFIREWLREMIPNNVKVTYNYSIFGNFLPKYNTSGEDLIMTSGLREYEKDYRALFVDDNSKSLEEYISNIYPGLDYMTSEDFVRTFNNNPRVYEKKTKPIQKTN